MQDDSDRWQKLKDAFISVNELAPESRPAFLSELRRRENTIFQELSELLDAEEKSADFLHKPFDFAADDSLIGEIVGHYRIVREIGRGGMGAVFEAVREDGAFEQKAAVKLTDRSLFSDELVRRFRTERQILARLEHANIVRLLDGGLTRQHVPYFVMEFVEGAPITEFCAENNSSIDERLTLFLQICEAVLYAHRQLIVHRDLKPSNILVTRERQVKLLDFGIAKILDSDAQTLTANAPLTPEYASPEQIKGEIITTASDIYSLGVILYELLTGKTPCGIYGVERGNLPRGVCESEPVRPSSLVISPSPIEQGATAELKKRRTNDKGLKTKSLKGDLDNIVLKALRKEKEERYGSVEQFAADIRAYLQGLPVKAHPQSFDYRARKFVRRNRLAVAIAAVSALLIFAGTTTAVWQSIEARHQRQIAERNFSQVRRIANSLILDYHDEIARLEGATALREKLVVDAVNYLDNISTAETSDPELLKETAIAYRKIGTVQGKPYAANLGKIDEAVRNLEKSAALLEKAVSIEPADLSLRDELVKSYDETAQVRARAGKNQYETYQKAAAINDESISRDEENLERKIYGLRLRIFLTDQSPESEPQHIEDYKKIIGDAEPLFSQQPNNVNIVAILAMASERLANRYRSEGLYRLEEGATEAAADSFGQSEEYARQSLRYMTRRQEIEPTDGNNRRRLFVANSNLSMVLIRLKKFDEAEKHLQIAAGITDQSKRDDPNNKEPMIDELSILKNRFEIAIFKNQPEAAFQIAGRAISIAEDFEKSSPQNAEIIDWIGYFYNRQRLILEDQGKEKEAQNHRRILEKLKNKYVERFKSSPPDFSGIGLG